ncbi:S-adenosyl-L-methionine-dependent methyltransferase [Mycena metata]|uniref:S-adenosyl-L-methionine-dependent methyltransferase n=1 Tax=Mycena metata TaxID=1033252 RepID=A0AAD7IQV2_9AGAR|nr:S-adenosyl-L-methionine-dependent methyltransferase [Mycena metata]
MTLALLSSRLGARQAALEYQWMKRATSGLPLDEMLARRVAGEPLQYILGDQPFGPLTIKLRPPVLIPRPETEHWTIRLAELLRPPTRTGCIPLLLCHLLPAGTVRARGVDISSDAVKLAGENAALCGFSASVAGSTRNTFQPIQASFLDPLFPHKNLGVDPPFDLVVSNPPYISWAEYLELPPSVTHYEDPKALFGVARKGFLNPGAVVAVEVGDGQADRVQEIFHDLIVSPTSTVAIPWTQLIRLDLGFIPSVSACLSIMSGCPKLESCNLIVDPAQGLLPSLPIVLPVLTSLELHIRADELASLLDRAVFPALTSITLYVQEAFDDHASWPQTSFVDFLSRSKCALARLELHDTGVQPTQFIECLQHEGVRGIGELVIHDSRDWTWDPVITPRLVQLLTLPSSDAPTPTPDSSESGHLLPALRTLDLGKGCWTCPGGLLSHMIESRWRTTARDVARLERVHVDLHLLEDVYGPDHTRLEKLREEGMKVRITYFHD